MNTPRTENEIVTNHKKYSGSLVSAEFARKLETELNELTAAASDVQDAIIKSANGERDNQWLAKMSRLQTAIAAAMPNDPKLSHGANKRKREFAMQRKMKEQSPLAPARC